MADLHQLMELGERMRLESLVYYPPIDPGWLREKLAVVFAHPELFCYFVADNGGLEGFLLGYVAGYIFSPAKVAAHDIFYVAPEARRSVSALRLIRAFIHWAESLGIERQLIRLDTGLRPDKVDRLYRWFGFEPIGGQYLRCAFRPSSEQSGH